MKEIKIKMRNRLLNSSIFKKQILSIFLVLSIVISSSAQNCQIIDAASITNVSCYSGNDGAIDVVLLNPFGNYSFLWSTTESTEDINNLTPGMYSVTITDLTPGSSCVQDTSFIITAPQDPLSAAITLYSDIDCYGDSSGVAYAENAIGGTFPYSYSWDNGQNTQLGVNLWAGTHIVTVTDANLCTAQASIDIVNSNLAITGTVNIQSSIDYAPYDISCFGVCDAMVELISGGGVLPHTYSWSTGQVYPSGSGPDTASGLCFGGHDVLIEDALGCRKTIYFNITQPDELFANAEMVQHVQCYGFDDGMAFATATQGTPTYTFVWDSINGPTGQNIDSLTPGIHTVYVTDENGCTASDTVLITEPTLLEVDIIDSLAVYAYCSNTVSGELCAIASGGTPNYLYAWNDVNHQTTPCAYNLQADQYTITVMDDRNCIAQASFDLDSITNSMNPDSVVVIEDPVSCFGLYDGELTITNVVGGVSPYSYNWNGPGTYTGFGSNITSLYAGNYSVLISDSNGCQMTIGTYLNEPDQLEYDVYNTVDETCLGAENGQIWVHVNGGTSPYYYDDSEVGDFTVPFPNPIQLLNDSLIFNLASGTHSIYITDEHECEGAVTFGAGTGGWQRDINTLLEVDIPQVNLINNTTTCYNINDGSAQVVDISTDSLFTYTWEEDNAGTPSGIDISNGAGISWGAFAPGDYWLVAHYADSASFGIPYSGCDNAISFTILAAAPEITVLFNITNVSCYEGNNGQIDLDISGGWGAPYQVNWDTTSALPSGSNATLIEDLTVGTYAVSISDANGCITIADDEVTEPSPLISDIVPTHATCYGFDDGSALVEGVAGTGTPSYEFEWNTVPITSPISSTDEADNLFAGTYIVTVTDDEDCFYTDTVVILQPADPVTVVEVDSLYHGDFDVSCNGESDASASAVGSGISFEWFDEDDYPVLDEDGYPVTGQNTGEVLGAGEYTVVAEDANGCLGEATIIITEPEELEVSVEESQYGGGYQVSCYNLDDGWAEVFIEGGVPHGDSANNIVPYYDIEWEDEDGKEWGDDSIAINLEAGHYYTVTVTDANGCEDDATTDLYTEPIEFIAKVTTLNYPGPLHGPVEISFIDSTQSDEEYEFDWYWNYTIGDNDPEEFNNVDESDNKIFTHEFVLWDSNNDNDDDFVTQGDWMNIYNVLVALENEETHCKDTLEFTIEVQGMPEVNNVFTPNGDEWNAEFSFSEYAMESVDVQIFNRWGQLVKSWVGSDKSWDGTGIDGNDLPEGVYFYVFVGQGVDGYYYDRKGTVTLLR